MQTMLKLAYSDAEEVALRFREDGAGVQALTDAFADLQENWICGGQQAREALAAPKPQCVHRGLPGIAVPIPANLKVWIWFPCTRRSLALPFGLLAPRRVGAELGMPGSAAGLDNIQRLKQCRLIALKPPGSGLEETQRRLESKWPIQLHARTER
ncbi:hypothetical protein [Nonomuraea sp. NPDC002799]